MSLCRYADMPNYELCIMNYALLIYFSIPMTVWLPVVD